MNSISVQTCITILKRLYNPPKRGFNTKRKRQRKKLKKSRAYAAYIIMYGENPFLKLLKKERFNGAYIPVPLYYGNIDE